VALVSVAVPSGAATKSISIRGVTTPPYDPKVAKGAQGTTFEWTNDDSINHTATQDGPLRKWDTGVVSPGASDGSTVNWAGTYPYHCSIHTSMKGVVKVPIVLSATSVSVGSAVTVTVATQNAPSGYTYDVQTKTGSGSWGFWQRGVSGRNQTFTPSTAGTYSFRARLRDTAGTNKGATSGWSPSKSVTAT